jgi:hypothetical protein
LAERGEADIAASRYVALTTPGELRDEMRQRAARRSRALE